MPLILLLFAAACSASAPASRPQSLSGAETAKRAGEATRKAESSGTTGVLVASSEDDAAEVAEPDTPAPDTPAPDTPELTSPEPAVLHVTLTVNASLVDGEPVELATYFAQQTARNPTPHLVFLVSPELTYGVVVEAIDLATAAGLTRVAIEFAPADEPAAAQP